PKGEKLSAKELLHNRIFLLNAGHETTTNLIGNGLVTLSTCADEKRRLIGQPELIKTAIEEMLRYESSNQLGNRMTVEPVELGGLSLPAGTPVTPFLGGGPPAPCELPEPQGFRLPTAPQRP